MKKSNFVKHLNHPQVPCIFYNSEFLCRKSLPSKEKHMGVNIIETQNCGLENSTPIGIYSMG